MKFSIEKTDFIKTLQKIQGIVDKRNTMPILANALLEVSGNTLTVIATDLEVFIRDHAPIEKKEDGSTTIGAKKLFEIAKELPEGRIDVSSGKEERVTVKGGKARFTIMGLPSKDFPSFPFVDDSELEAIEGGLLKDMIDKTCFAVSTDETRYNINGFLFEKTPTSLKMVTTDGHRLACIEKNGYGAKEALKVLVPRKGMMELRRLLDEKDGEFYIAIGQKNACMKKDETVVNVRLLEGEFPDYTKVVPKDNDKKIVAERVLLQASLKRVSLLSSDKARGVRFNFSPSKLILSSSSPDLGDATEELDIEYNGPEVEVSFNARYFMDVLEALKDEKVAIELKNSLSPGLIRQTTSEDYIYVIMPMRL